MKSKEDLDVIFLEINEEVRREKDTEEARIEREKAEAQKQEKERRALRQQSINDRIARARKTMAKLILKSPIFAKYLNELLENKGEAQYGDDYRSGPLVGQHKAKQKPELGFDILSILPSDAKACELVKMPYTEMILKVAFYTEPSSRSTGIALVIRKRKYQNAQDEKRKKPKFLLEVCKSVYDPRQSFTTWEAQTYFEEIEGIESALYELQNPDTAIRYFLKNVSLPPRGTV